MSSSSDRKLRQKGGGWRLFFILNAVALFFLIIAFGREYLGNLQIDQEIRALEDEREVLEQDQLETLSLIEELSSEYYLEQEARSKHGLGREGETLVVIQSDSETDESSATTPEEEAEMAAVGNWVRWYYYFFNQAALSDLVDLDT